MKIDYSVQAELLIKSLKSFNRADFEAWFIANLQVGNKTIFEYLVFKNKEGK